MKSFTATQLNKSAQVVFAAAKEDTVYIKHDRYEGGFTITHTLLTPGQVAEIMRWEDSLITGFSEATGGDN